MLYTNKPVRLIFLTVMSLSLALSWGHMQPVSAQSKDAKAYLLLASPGSLDLTFDGDGRVTTTFGTLQNESRAVATQPDGKIVVAGFQGNSTFTRDFAVARYNNDGSLDSSFDADGKAIAGFGYAVARDIAIQSDGKIVVAGQGYDDLGAQLFILARFNSNGSLDTSFDTDGRVITEIGEAYALAIQSDGKLLVTGSRDTGAFLDSEIVLARYNTNGSLDTTFDSDGYLTTNPGSDHDSGRSIVVKSDGKIIVGGSSYDEESEPDYALLRYNTNGSLDTSFDGDGVVITDFSNSADYEAGIALQPDGKIIFAGSSYGVAPYLSAVLMRFNNNGSLDPTFDGDGKVSTSFANESQINDVALQSNGKIVVAGVNSPNNVNDFANDFFLLRYNADGSLDTGFDTDGKVTTDFGSTKDFGNSIAIQSDGNIVVAGSRSIDNTNSTFAVARYIGDIAAAAVDVKVAGTTVGNDIEIPLGSGQRHGFTVDNGPAKVVSTNGFDIVAALRVIWREPGLRTSYSEMMGLPVEQLSDEYWFPWYNNLDKASMDQGFRIANVDAFDTTVKVMLGTTELDSFILPAGASVRTAYDVNDGPIQIYSEGGHNILAALRVIWKEPGYRSSYSEMMGLPKEQLSSEYWFPWYNNAVPASMDQGFRIANVDTTASNTVEVWVGATQLDTIVLGAGASTRVGYSVDNGPIRIVCTTCTNSGNDKIIAALRVIWKEPGFRASYSEMMGLPTEQLSSQYWFPWYNNAVPASMDQGFRIANISAIEENTVEVWVGSTKLATLTLGVGGSTRVGYNVDNGPIRIICTSCTNLGSDKILAALRVIWKEPGFRSSYSEMMGLPHEALSTEYWFPWYNFAAPNSMDQGFRIAVP